MSCNHILSFSGSDTPVDFSFSVCYALQPEWHLLLQLSCPCRQVQLCTLSYPTMYYCTALATP
eukprot:1141970-Pelagomonas_calceolata.AAC.14